MIRRPRPCAGAAPPGCEREARGFYGSLLGLRELEKPEELQARGGVWFARRRAGAARRRRRGLHARRKAHPGLRVGSDAELDALAEVLTAAGADVQLGRSHRRPPPLLHRRSVGEPDRGARPLGGVAPGPAGPRRAARRGCRRARAQVVARPGGRRRVERARRRAPTGSSRSITRAPAPASDLAQLGLRPDGAEHAGAGADHGGGLVAQRRVGQRARGPVDGVLEHARDRVVVLRRREQDARRPRRSPRAARRRRGRGLGVARRPRRTAGSPSARRTRRAPPRAAAAARPPGAASCCSESRAQRARDAEDPHGGYACCASSSSTMQLDVVGEREAALGQRRVPVQAELGAVDDRLERRGRSCRRRRA